MTLQQTITIPTSHQLIINVPSAIPAGKAILTFTPASSDLLATGKTKPAAPSLNKPGFVPYYLLYCIAKGQNLLRPHVAPTV